MGNIMKRNLLFLLLAISVSPAVDAQSWPGGTGPCGQISTTINILKEADFALRVNPLYINKLVNLVLQNDITAYQGIVFNSSFNCTILSSSGNWTIYASDNTFTLFTIQGAQNVLTTNINFATNYTIDYTLPPYAGTSTCTEPLGCACANGKRAREGGSPNCPTIGVYNSVGIQITRGVVYGRTDMFYTNFGVVDSMTMRNKQSDQGGTLRISYNGDDVNLLMSEVYVTNNYIYGGFSGLITNFNARGVTARNNYFADFVWSAIRCGDFVSLVGDCMLLTFAYNYMYLDPDLPVYPDSTAIYVNNHWINPGNLFRCNYAENTGYAVYLDIASSTNTIDGLVAIRPRATGVKLNQCGKMNTVTSMLIVQGKGTAGWISCQDCQTYNCDDVVWDTKRKARYNNTLWNTNFPEITTICGTYYMDGMSCNPPADGATGVLASVTAGCSGVPYHNNLQFAVVEPNTTNAATGKAAPLNSSFPFLTRECTNTSAQLSAVNFLNNMRVMVYPTVTEMGFVNPGVADYGVTAKSKIFAFDAKWRSCPRSNVGPKTVNPAVYMSNFNVAPTTPLPLYDRTKQYSI